MTDFEKKLSLSL